MKGVWGRVVVADLARRQGVRVSVKAEDSVLFSWTCFLGIKAEGLREVRKVRIRGVGERRT